MSSGLAADTIVERDMLKTRVQERGMSVTTWLHRTEPRASPSWTAVWAEQDGRPESISLVWLHFWSATTTPGGLAEAHEAVVERVRAGTLPAQDHGAEEGAGAKALLTPSLLSSSGRRSTPATRYICWDEVVAPRCGWRFCAFCSSWVRWRPRWPRWLMPRARIGSHG